MVNHKLSTYLPETDQDHSSRVKQPMIWYWCPGCRTQAWVAKIDIDKKTNEILNYPHCAQCGKEMEYLTEFMHDPGCPVMIPPLPIIDDAKLIEQAYVRTRGEY